MSNPYATTGHPYQRPEVESASSLTPEQLPMAEGHHDKRAKMMKNTTLAERLYERVQGEDDLLTRGVLREAARRLQAYAEAQMVAPEGNDWWLK